MRTFRRRLVVTPLLLATALMALGLPATAGEVYEQNSSTACCATQDCCANRPAGESGPGTGQTNCAEGTDQAEKACCPESECENSSAARRPGTPAAVERPGRAALSGGQYRAQGCVESQRCCPGALSELGCCL